MSKNYGEVKVNVDTVLLTLKDGILQVALSPRQSEYKKGELALVGAIMDGNKDKTLENVVDRSLKEKLGLKDIYYEQLFTFSGNGRKSARDQRWPSIDVSYIALVAQERLDAVMSKGSEIEFHPVNNVPHLPFDHNEIIDFAVKRLRGKGAWSLLPAHLLNDEFTMSEMLNVYSKVLDTSINGANFRRKVLGNKMITPLGRQINSSTSKRPSDLFKINKNVFNVDIKI